MPDQRNILVVYVPQPATDEVLAALFAAGAGTEGEYEECAFVVPGRGQFRPVGSADPTIGTVGELTRVAEDRVEIAFPRRLLPEVLEALRAAHPYEVPAFHVLRDESRRIGY